MAKIPVERIKHWDIYSCFPCAVQVCAQELGIDHADGTKLTLIGGSAFHGQPGMIYSMHAIAAMVERLRTCPGDFGMVTANGGYLSKHAAGIYSTTPYQASHPGAQWRREDPLQYQAQLDAVSGAVVAAAPAGTGRVETYTVIHGAKGPQRAIVVGRLQDGPDAGKRFVATSADSATMKRMRSEDALGMLVRVSTQGERSQFAISHPTFDFHGGESSNYVPVAKL